MLCNFHVGGILEVKCIEFSKFVPLMPVILTLGGYSDCATFGPRRTLGSSNNYSVWIVSCLLYFFPYSFLSNYFLLSCICLILFLLLPRAGVLENTRA